jgi:hypothetical protein
MPPVGSMLGRSVSLAWRGDAMRLEDDFPAPPGGTVPVAAEIRSEGVLVQVPHGSAPGEAT